jgi:cell division protease FtsH
MNISHRLRDVFGTYFPLQQSGDTQKAVPPSPLPRDKQGWRVAPAPDGRGAPEQPPRTPPHRLRGFWIFVLVLLALNWASVLVSQPSAQPRVKVPFNPYFLRQLQAGRITSIASKDDTIQGTFASAVRYPASDRRATPTTLFSTQVPSFWNNTALTQLLVSKGVQVNATNPNPGTSLLAELLLGFGPTLLLVCSPGARRAAPAGSAAWASSDAPRRGGSTRTRSGSRSRTSPGSTRPRRS